MKIDEQNKVVIVESKSKERKNKRKLSEGEIIKKEKRERGIWIVRKEGNAKVEIFIPWKKGLKGKYVDLSQKIEIARIDWQEKTIKCFLCNESFNEQEVEKHYGRCKGNPGRLIDKIVRKELNLELGGGISEFVNRKGEFKVSGTTVVSRIVSNRSLKRFDKMNRASKKEIKSKEGIERMIVLKEELEQLEKKYGQLV